MSDASEDLYWRLHTLSKMLESSDIIDGTVHRDAYPAILDAMTAVRATPRNERLREFADSLVPTPTNHPAGAKLIKETEKRIRQALIYGTSHPEALQVAFNKTFERSQRIAAERDDALSELQAEKLINEGLRKTPITDETYIGLAEDIARLTAEGEALKRFALAMLEHWPLGDVDGGELQEEAVKHGLLVPEKRTAVCCEEGCTCAEYYSPEEWAEGITCYRKAPWLFPAKPSTKEGPSC